MTEPTKTYGDTPAETYIVHSTPDAQVPSSGSLVEKRQAKAGAPLGNQNASRHGLKGIGWPSGSDVDRRAVSAFTRALTDAVLDAGGKLDIPTVGTIQTCARHERHARLCGRWLRLQPDLTIDQKRALSLDIARASEARDKAIRELNIGSKAHVDPWAAIDAIATPTEPDDKPNASARRTEPMEGN